MVRTALVAALVLAACKSEKREQPPAAASGSAPVAADAAVAKPIVDACLIGTAAIDAATCKTPEARDKLQLAKKSLDGVLSTVGASAAEPRQLQVMCAQLLLAIERDAAKTSCVLALEDTKRAQIMKLLDEWYAQRTPVTPTGHAAADAVIAKIAAVRDLACECKTGACLDSLDPELVSVPVMPTDAPDAARTLASKVLEDAARCANRVRTITDPPK